MHDNELAEIYKRVSGERKRKLLTVTIFSF